MKTSSKAKAKSASPPKKRKKNRSRNTLPVLRNISIANAVEKLRPAIPTYIIRPEKLASMADLFVKNFPGRVMYAVKCNPDLEVLKTLYKHGIRAFDAASIEEIKLVRRAAPNAKIYFMHTVKTPESIHLAYHKYGVRSFSLDTEEELYKILRQTDLAQDLELFVRLALPKNDSAQIDFSAKFGASPEEAIPLLQKCRAVAAKLGICFHPGTQTMDPAAYTKGIRISVETAKQAAVTIDALDIGAKRGTRRCDSEHRLFSIVRPKRWIVSINAAARR